MAHCQYHASSRRDHNGEFITTRESLSYQTSLRHMLTPSYIVSVARLDHQLIWLWAAAKPQPPMQQPTGFMGLADSTAYVCHVMCATHILMISLICGCRKRTPPPHTHTHTLLSDLAFSGGSEDRILGLESCIIVVLVLWFDCVPCIF